MTAFRSVLAATIRSYLTLKRALGRQYSNEEHVLAHLDRFLAARRVDLVAETFAAWCLTLQHLASVTRRGRMRVVRNLCLYRRRGESGCFVPDERLFPPVHQAIRPHIFTDSQIVQLLAVAGTLPRTSNSPLRPENMRLAIVLLSTSGLRRGELTRLTVGDYDPPQRTLTIRQSKFYKSRLVPVSADAALEVEHLIAVRNRRRFPAGADSPLLWHRHPGTGGYSGGGLGGAMRALFRRAGIRTATGHLPRTHDFRHGFAVNALLRWYRAGLDVQAKLPFLAAYMGHVSVVSTAYYCSSSNPSRPRPARDSRTTAVTSSRDPSVREVRDDRQRPERPGPSPPGVLPRSPAPGARNESPHRPELSGQPGAVAALRRNADATVRHPVGPGRPRATADPRVS